MSEQNPNKGSSFCVNAFRERVKGSSSLLNTCQPKTLQGINSHSEKGLILVSLKLYMIYLAFPHQKKRPTITFVGPNPFRLMLDGLFLAVLVQTPCEGRSDERFDLRVRLPHERDNSFLCIEHIETRS